MALQIDNSVVQSRESQSFITPQMAIELLTDGNRRYVERKMLNRDLVAQTRETSKGQYPFAVILSCIDSRVPAELVFDQGIGDIFNVRIAGNFINTDILGSLEFACKVAGSKAVVVMGHKSCGAVKGACDGVELGNLTEMLSKIRPAVEAVTEITENRNSSNAEFVQRVADENVRLTTASILAHSPVLKDMHENGEIAVVGAMYDVETGVVEFRD